MPADQPSPEPQACPFIFSASDNGHTTGINKGFMDGFYVACSCGARGPVAVIPSDAVQAWNERRHAPSAPTEAAPLLSAEINALPERVRRHIHDLETICDPTG